MSRVSEVVIPCAVLLIQRNPRINGLIKLPLKLQQVDKDLWIGTKLDIHNSCDQLVAVVEHIEETGVLEFLNLEARVKRVSQIESRFEEAMALNKV